MNQDLPNDIVEDLLQAIRSAFYPDANAERWSQDKYFLKIHVVTWPADWLSERAITLKPERYKQILLDIFMGIKRHGATDKIKHIPRYLTHCVQEHFRIHEDEIYAEGKSLRTAIEKAVDRAQRSVGAADPIAAIAQAHRVLVGTRKRAKKPAKPASQPDLFKL